MAGMESIFYFLPWRLAIILGAYLAINYMASKGLRKFLLGICQCYIRAKIAKMQCFGLQTLSQPFPQGLHQQVGRPQRA